MDGVSAAASFIAIAQALAAIPKIIDVLNTLVHARRELLQLVNEVELLSSFREFVEQTIQHLQDEQLRAGFRIPQPALLQFVQDDLEKVVEQLRKLTHNWKQDMINDGRIRFVAIKWLRYQRKIRTLSKRAKQDRESLQEILSYTSLFISTSHGKMIVDIHTIVTTRVYQGNNLLLPLSGLIDESHCIGEVVSHTDGDANYDATEKSLGVITNCATATGTDDKHQLNPSDNKGYNGSQLNRSSGAVQNDEPLVRITAALRRVCVRGCACQCHSYASRSWPHPTTSFVSGWLQSAYNSIPKFSRDGCDVSTCRRAGSSTHFTLHVPLPFYSRACEATLSLNSIAGLSASLHLRVTRMIGPDDIIWSEIRMGKIKRIQLRISRREYSPFDGDQTKSILKEVIMSSQWEIVSILLGESMATLRGTDLGRQVAIAARWNLYAWDESFGEQPKRLMQTAAELDDADEDEYWPIHNAVRNISDDLVAILKECPEGIDALDNFGCTPLHWAARCHNITAFRTLISHGANLDVRDSDGFTPLLLATWFGEHEMIQTLINRGCDIRPVDHGRMSALYYTLQSKYANSSKDVKLLLDRGAGFVFPGGCDALHILARHPEAAGMEQKFQLLLGIGLSPEKKDDWGLTPMNLTLRYNHKAMMRLLYDAGCKLDISPNGWNFLFCAAQFGKMECIDLFEGVKPMVDLRVRDDDGDTPLDVLELTMKTDASWLPGVVRHPSQRDIDAFTRLLQGIRDRYLAAEIQTLGTVVEYLQAEDVMLAREALQPIIQEKVHWNIPTECRTFRAIDIQIKEKMIEAAVESLEEFIQVSRERIGTDPFEGDYCRGSSLQDQGLIIQDTI
ncbi:ankyrin [Hypomontagnella monticulosa]|nr:ankyrin [Hypomontagnella monticulosa]